MNWEFIKINPGSFLMGSPENEQGRYSDETQHTVVLTAFEIGATQVTQAQWVSVMGDNPSYFKGDNLPVEQVSWDDTQRFIEKLNSSQTEFHYRLPTEAKWEYCARAGTQTRYFFGDSEKDLDDYAWYLNNSENKTHLVAMKKPNLWGLYDVYGNVWEWCQDGYKKYSKDNIVDPMGVENGSFRVLRGGSWFSAARYLRSASRYNYGPGLRHGDVGFRLCREKRDDCIQKSTQENLQKEPTQSLVHVKNVEEITESTAIMKIIKNLLKSNFYVENATFNAIKNGEIGGMEIESLNLALFVGNLLSQKGTTIRLNLADESVLRNLREGPHEKDGTNILAKRDEALKQVRVIGKKLKKLEEILK